MNEVTRPFPALGAADGGGGSQGFQYRKVKFDSVIQAINLVPNNNDVDGIAVAISVGGRRVALQPTSLRSSMSRGNVSVSAFCPRKARERRYARAACRGMKRVEQRVPRQMRECKGARQDEAGRTVQ